MIHAVHYFISSFVAVSKTEMRIVKVRNILHVLRNEAKEAHK